MATQLKSQTVRSDSSWQLRAIWIGAGITSVVAIVAILAFLLNRGESVAALASDLGGSDAHLRHAAARKLARLGAESREAVPQLAAALKDPDQRVRHASAKALSDIGIDAKPAMSALIESLTETDADTRYYVVKALSKVDPDKTEVHAVPALIRLLKDENPKTRYYAAKCLKSIGPAANSAIPALRAAANDSDAEMREMATAALSKVSKTK
jgi:HEAT repeat protein